MTPDQIKSLRVQLGLSQREMAEQLNRIDSSMRTSAITISRWETGDRSPSPRSVAALEQLALAGTRTRYTLPIDRETMADLIRKYGALRMIAAVKGLDMHLAMVEGVNLAGWRVSQTADGFAAVFGRYAEPEQPEELRDLDAERAALAKEQRDLLPRSYHDGDARRRYEELRNRINELDHQRSAKLRELALQPNPAVEAVLYVRDGDHATWQRMVDEMPDMPTVVICDPMPIF